MSCRSKVGCRGKQTRGSKNLNSKWGTTTNRATAGGRDERHSERRIGMSSLMVRGPWGRYYPSGRLLKKWVKRIEEAETGRVWPENEGEIGASPMAQFRLRLRYRNTPYPAAP